MDEYAKDMKRFKASTTIAKFMELKRQFCQLRDLPKRHKVMKIKQHIDTAETTLLYLDHIMPDYRSLPTHPSWA